MLFLAVFFQAFPLECFLAAASELLVLLDFGCLRDDADDSVSEELSTVEKSDKCWPKLFKRCVERELIRSKNITLKITDYTVIGVTNMTRSSHC